jgi:uncharacterized protein (TIGR02145 family)
MRTQTLCKYIRNRVNPLILLIGVLTILTACDDKATQEAEAAKAAAETAIAAAKAKEAAAKEAIAKLKAAAPAAASGGGNTFTDSRDGKVYKTVKIGSQTWLAENLNYEAKGSLCYDNKKENCDKYGRLYDWNTAKAACPSGWHLPTQQEWNVLTAFIGGENTEGKKLKAKSGWHKKGPDEYGFAALTGGGCLSDGDFRTAGDNGNWWSATERDASQAYHRYMDYEYEGASWGYNDKTRLYSIRCIRD